MHASKDNVALAALWEPFSAHRDTSFCPPTGTVPPSSVFTEGACNSDCKYDFCQMMLSDLEEFEDIAFVHMCHRRVHGACGSWNSDGGL